jgi:putative transposase
VPPSATLRAGPSFNAGYAALKVEIARMFDDNFGVYGHRKVWGQLNREDIAVARCTVQR